MFSRSFLRSEDFLLQNSAILRNAARMLNGELTRVYCFCRLIRSTAVEIVGIITY